MNFNSLHFLIFLPVVLIGYWLLPQRFRWILLLAASYYFYMSWNPWLVFLILGTTVVSYGAGIAIEKSSKPGMRKFLLAATLVVCFGILFFFKYFNFLLDSVFSLIRLFVPEAESPALDLILPVGISFYTFQTLSYVIDVYRGDFRAETHFGYYALFVSFFPQLVAGPIERPGDLIPQLRAEHKLNSDDMEAGLRIMISGFFRKCVIADSCAVFVNSVFSDLSSANSLAIALAGFLFLIQMYNDFAGYSEIAMGAARMMGIKLTVNFDRPLLATGFRSFFRRWHITLTRWFTDYLYIPLGGNRKGKGRRIFNTFVVFAVCGLWHGANWTYVIWGLYAAFFISLEILLKTPLAKISAKLHINTASAPVIYAKRLIFILLSVPSALIFRSTSIFEAWECLTGLFSGAGFGIGYLNDAMTALSMSAADIVQIGLCLACLFLLGNFVFYGGNGMPGLRMGKALDGQVKTMNVLNRVSAYWFGILAVALGWLILIADSDASSFAYFQF